MNGRRLIHVWSAMGLRSQSSRLLWYNPQCTRRSIALMRSCWVVYGFLASVAISWMSVHHLNRISRGSCGLYAVKKLTLFWRIASGVGLPYVDAIWLKMSQIDIVAFHPVVGGVVGGATLEASLTCSSSVS